MISRLAPPPDEEKNIEENFEKQIAAFSSFNIFTHKNPDGDALGSALAMQKILELRNKKAAIFIFDSLPRQFSFFPGIHKIKILREPPETSGAMSIFIDCASPERTGFDFSLSEKERYIAIDHHLFIGPKKENILYIVDHAVSSTAEIIFTLTEKLKWKTSRDISFCLLAGILSDTGIFQHSNTSSKTLHAVSRLIKSGVNLKKISESLSPKKEFDSSLKMWGKILSRASLDRETKMLYSFAAEEDLKNYRVTEEELGGLANLLSGSPESAFSMLLTENKFGKTRASLRSESYKKIDVSKIAQAFGGGGHKLAAGFEVKGKIKDRLQEIKEKIKEELKKQR